VALGVAFALLFIKPSLAQTPSLDCGQTATLEERASCTTAAMDACHSIADALRTSATMDIKEGQSVEDVLVAAPGSPLRLDEKVGGQYVLESTYQGTLNCQSPHLFEDANGTKREISLPDGFAAEEGSLCGPDKVHLASVSGIPGLLRKTTSNVGTGQYTTFGITLRTGLRWTERCSVNILTRSSYRVRFARCADGNCGHLVDMAEEYSKLHHGLIEGRTLPSEEELSVDQRVKFAELARLANDYANLDQIPLFADQAEESKLRWSEPPYCSFSFDGLGGETFPVVYDGQVFLGIIGHDGFGLGAHSGGPNDALAIYRKGAGGLEPVAGFCVIVGGQAITSITTN
jgi:hypothetical protein